jgi:hypothetical protein
MKTDYHFFHSLLLNWWQGTRTKNELVMEVGSIFKITKISEWSDFINDFEESLREFNEKYYFDWIDYKEYAKETAPTVNGLIHSIKEFKLGNITKEDFINWACWHNGDCGETTSGVFENKNIEYFCLFFLPYHYENLDNNFYSKAISIIEKSNNLSYGEFVIAVNMLIEKEKKSMYFFFKSFLEEKKSEEELNTYLEKKYNVNLPEFKFDLSVFPYKNELNLIKKNGDGIESIMNIMEK